MEIIIFSKNRPMQLHCLLRSIQKNIGPIRCSILYCFDKEFKEGYNKIISSCHNWILEDNFKFDLKNIISNSIDKHVMFLVDDCVVIRKLPFIDTVLENCDIATVAMRLGLNIDCHRYNTGDQIETINVPEHVLINKEIICWNWQNAESYWKSHASLDGNVYRTEEIAGFLNSAEYGNPWELEKKMSKRSVARLMAAPTHSCIVNYECNKLKTTKGNLSLSTIELNNKFMNGLQIMLPSEATSPRCPHIREDYRYESY